MKQYRKSNIPPAKQLRKEMTPWERKLWYDYLCRYPVRFQRQKAIGDFTVDFYCAKARLAIELDGSGHYEQWQSDKDRLRTERLAAMNVRVLRFCNLDLDRNFRGVCELIDSEVQKSIPQSAALTAPSSEWAMARKIYALGFFDGVHLGHQALLAACVALAEEGDALPAAITFDRHPRALLDATPPALLQSAADRRALLAEYGMAEVRLLPVTAEVMGQNWQDFLEMLCRDGAAGFVCGYDFRFGHRGEGDAEKLRRFCGERGLPCVIVPEQRLDGIRISSTHIRHLVEAGQMEEAARFLGHSHQITGTVVPGRQVGRTMGVPTANVLFCEGVAIPKLGVYACAVTVDGRRCRAVTNVGSRPTVGGHQTRAESWILDFEGDLYGREIRLEFLRFLRPERKFDSLEELKNQIQKDAETAKNVCNF